MDERKEENKNSVKKITQEEFNQKLKKQLNDISKIFSDYNKNHQETEDKGDDEER